MPVRDDEQFEKYLKQFRPVAPEALPVKEQVRATRRPWLVAAGAAVAAPFLAVIVSVFLHWPPHRPGEIRTSKLSVEDLNNPQPLTIRGANALLASAPSFKAAVESVAFQPGSRPLSGGRHSALAALGKEESKL